MKESAVERMIKTNPNLEIWWDSSPLVFKPWVEKLVNAALPERKAELREQLERLYNAKSPAASVFRGCTTNPPLSWSAVQSDPKYWATWVAQESAANPDMDTKQVAWRTYKEIVKRGAELFLPIHRASAGRFGWISGQLDPRLFTEVDQMVHDAEELSGLAPNVMIKVPGSMQGMEVLKILASKGISTNTTTCFTLPQTMASADATRAGMELAEKNNVDLGNWRAVITMMTGRLTEHPVLDVQAERKNIRLSWADKHWWGIGVFRRAYRILSDGGYPSKMLACSIRPGPLVAGKMQYWDLQKIAGGDIVYTSAHHTSSSRCSRNVTTSSFERRSMNRSRSMCGTRSCRSPTVFRLRIRTAWRQNSSTRIHPRCPRWSCSPRASRAWKISRRNT